MCALVSLISHNELLRRLIILFIIYILFKLSNPPASESVRSTRLAPKLAIGKAPKLLSDFIIIIYVPKIYLKVILPALELSVAFSKKFLH